MQFTKETEGKTILAVPTGNNARRSASKDPIEFEVIRVKRKYVEMCKKGSQLSDNYDPRTGATQSAIRSGYGGNAGYLFFADKREYYEYECQKTLINNVVKMTRGFSLSRDLEKLSKDDLKTLEHILLKVCDR